MSRRSKSRPVEELSLTYQFNQHSEDIEDVYAEMFKAPVQAEALPSPAVSPEKPGAEPGDLPEGITTSVDIAAVERAAGLQGAVGSITTPVVKPGVDRASIDIHPDIVTGDVTPPVEMTPAGLPVVNAMLDAAGNASDQGTGGIKTPVIKTGAEHPPPIANSDRLPGAETADTTPPAETTRLGPTPVVMPSDITVANERSHGAGRPYNVHRAIQVQDGHNHTEQLLYDTLWRSGKPVDPDQGYRLVQIPQSDLATALRMTTKNLRAALERLAEKLSIEELHPFERGTRTARTWKVYSYKLILERRRNAGMDWVIRDRGVRFVDPRTAPVKKTAVVMEQE